MGPRLAQAERLPGFRRWLLYSVMRNVVAAILLLPRATARTVTDWLGRLAYLADRPDRKAASLANVQSAFPELPRDRAVDLLRRAYSHLVTSIYDSVAFSKAAKGGACDGLVEVLGLDSLPPARPDRGLIFVTGHFGTWEVLGAVASLLGYPVWSVRRAFENQFVEAYVLQLRGTTGQHLLPKRGSFRQMVRLLQQGENVALLVDQDARRHGIFVDFFGRPASTTTAPARLALRTGATIAFVYCERLGERFRVTIGDVIRPESGADAREEMRRITQRITTDIEEVVRASPDKWLWLHRRWKTYPGKYWRIAGGPARAARHAEPHAGAGISQE
jgi:KDO2-lipid IV(A) lauroyltransferase